MPTCKCTVVYLSYVGLNRAREEVERKGSGRVKKKKASKHRARTYSKIIVKHQRFETHAKGDGGSRIFFISFAVFFFFFQLHKWVFVGNGVYARHDSRIVRQ